MLSAHFKYALISLLFLSSFTSAHAQTLEEFPSTQATILSIDDTFWIAFNDCDLVTMQSFLDDSLEFYHDKGGLTESADKLIAMSKNERCNGNWPVVLRRELVAGSRKVYPINNYGAILYGEHLFYITENGGKEKLVESGKFMHIWQFKDNQWRMTRVVSYDHQNIENE